MKKFYKENYSSNLMTLSISSKMDIELLETKVKKYFSKL